jgi:molybdenum cofactor guanylyltransferase
MTTPDDLYGLIIAGGESKRMGTNKAFIQYHDKAQINYLFEILNNYCAEVYSSCKKKEEFEKELNPLPDQFDLDTPLNGILTAFHQQSEHAWLSVPVDMPNIDAFLIEHLIQNRDKTKAASCYFDSDGKSPDPLLCIWEPIIFSALVDYYKSGGYSPRELLQKSNIHLIEIPDKKYLININTPEELKAFRKKDY